MQELLATALERRQASELDAAGRLYEFYNAQPNHRPDKQVGVCDECWAKRPNFPELPRPTTLN